MMSPLTTFVKRKKASVLIMALWILGLLTVFTIQIGLGQQDKITFLSHMNQAQSLRFALKSGINKAIGIIKNEPLRNKTKNPVLRSWALYYNPANYKDLNINDIDIHIAYPFYEPPAYTPQTVYGVSDEERRLNLNTEDLKVIKRLLMLVAHLKEEDAQKLAGHIVDWRQEGQTVLEGFYSDNQYENLEFPYPEKKKPFETLDELRLVQGMTESIYDKIYDFVTIYGDGKTNLNTASPQVLEVLGFSPTQIVVINNLRKGVDGKWGTKDDHVYLNIDDFANELASALGIKDEELQELNQVINAAHFVTDSTLFRIVSEGKAIKRREKSSLTCVFDAINVKILYWHAS